MKRIVSTALLLQSALLPGLLGQGSGGESAAAKLSEVVVDVLWPDQQLVNGVQYVNRYQGCLGHPYFGETRLQPGSITLSGRIYEGLKLNYDLVTQDLELEYSGRFGMTNRIIVVNDFVEEFTLGSYQFRKMVLGDTVERYYQVISAPGFTCYIHWYKKLIPLADNINYLNECTDADQIFWLDREGRIDGFHNRKSYLSIFPDTSRKAIRKMMSRLQFRMNSATPEELVRMLEETAQIIREGGSG
jgi:hypothetical protein